MSTGWEEVYADGYPRLVALVTAVAGARVDAEEAVQEAFVRALGLTGRRAVVVDPEAWLYRVAVNVLRSRWRRALRGARLAVRSAPLEVAADRPEERLVLLEALKRLPFGQREALALHYLADLSVEQIATRTSAPTGTVKARLSRGRDALARLLTEDALEGGARHA